MRYASVLLMTLTITIAAEHLALASDSTKPREPLPYPKASPLGPLVAHATSIHLLKVASASDKCTSFEVVKTLKGKNEDAPYLALEGQQPFQADDAVLCFNLGSATLLHSKARWLSTDDWPGRGVTGAHRADRCDMVFDGPTDALCEHVSEILEGREVVITARSPRGWHKSNGGRKWRIRASLKITDWAISEESSNFVGWGTGDADEVPALERMLVSTVPKEQRLTAARDLVDLGPAARQSLPELRPVMRDSDAMAALAAASAIARIDANDTESIRAIVDRLGDADSGARAAAADSLGALGARAKSTTSALLKCLEDTESEVRDHAVAALGNITDDGAAQHEIVLALTRLLKREQSRAVRIRAMESLRDLGPQSWTAMETVRDCIRASSSEDKVIEIEREVEAAVELLTCLTPPPVEMLADLASDTELPWCTRATVINELRMLGPRAHIAMPSLRKALAEPIQSDFDPHLETANAILSIDPDAGKAIAAPVLIEMAKGGSVWRDRPMFLIARCGESGRECWSKDLGPFPRTAMEREVIRDLAPLLGPADRDLLADLHKKGLPGPGHFEYLAVLLQLGAFDEALDLAASCLRLKIDQDRHWAPQAARWLGEQGRAALAVEPALRRALEIADEAETARLLLTLWQVKGEPGSDMRTRAYAALGEVLAVAEGDSPRIGWCPSQLLWEPNTDRHDFYGIADGFEREQDIRVKKAVGVVLKQLRERPDVLVALDELLRNREPHLRLTAALVLAACDPDHHDTMAVLRELLLRYPSFFRFAADRLAALGRRGAPIAPVLSPLLRAPRESLRRSAASVLLQIDPVVTAKAWGSADIPGALTKDLASLWDELATGDFMRGDTALWRLGGGGERTVKLLHERLQPPPVLDAETIDRLICDLDSESFEVREHASNALGASVECAAPALRRIIKADPTLELRRRITELLESLESRNAPVARQRTRAIRLLEEMTIAGNAAAPQELKRLAVGDG